MLVFLTLHERVVLLLHQFEAFGVHFRDLLLVLQLLQHNTLLPLQLRQKLLGFELFLADLDDLLPLRVDSVVFVVLLLYQLVLHLKVLIDKWKSELKGRGLLN